MKILNFATVAALVLSSSLASAEAVPEGVKSIAPTLMDYGKSPALIAAVKQQNASGLSLDEIKKRDSDWRAATGVNEFMKSLMSGAAAKQMLSIEQSRPYFIEFFLMDNQGANVAMTSKTSDYWQGDEAKWKQSYKNGEGALHIGEVEFDTSAQAYLVQVSVPVVDGGKTIGAMTIGINLDELEK